MVNIFVARYEEKGVKKSLGFDKSRFDEAKATEYLNNLGVKNFFFFFEPAEPVQLDENSWLLSGDVGYDITVNSVLPIVQKNNNLVLDSFGGDLFEGYKIHDLLKSMNYTGKIKILGSCMSAATLPVMAVPIEQREMSDNSKFLVHNPWTWIVGDYKELQNEADFLQKETNNIAAIYSRETGKQTTEILDLMSKEIILDKEGAIEWGFIKDEIFSNNLNNNMANQLTKEDMEGVFDKFLNRIQNLFKGAVKNLALQTADGTTLDFGEAVTQESEIVVGLTGVTVDGSPATGDYVMPDGRTLKIEGGTITEIIEATDEGNNEEMEALKTENAELKQKVADLEAAQNRVNTELANFKNQMVSKFNAQTTNEKPEANPEPALRIPFKKK